MELDEWLRSFRLLGERAHKIARGLAGTPGAGKRLGRGAAGDETTSIDRALEEVVVEGAGVIGDIRLLSEELGYRDFGNPSACLVADPLDGSSNGELGIGVYAVSYALGPLEPTLGNIRLGYVRNLVSAHEYWAMKGGGAFRNGRPIRARDDAGLRMLLLELSPGHRRAMEACTPLAGRAEKVRCLGSMALDLCYVAQGGASAAADLRGKLGRPLDLSAAKLILEEAGGVVTDGKGGSLDQMKVDLEGRTDVLACANRKVLESLLELRED